MNLENKSIAQLREMAKDPAKAGFVAGEIQRMLKIRESEILEARRSFGTTPYDLFAIVVVSLFVGYMAALILIDYFVIKP